MIQVEVPDEVFGVCLDEGVPMDLSGWDGSGVPAAVVLRWVEACPLAPWSVTLLEQLPVGELAEADLPRLLAAWDRIEAHAGAGKARAIQALAGPKRRCTGWDDQDPAPNEVTVALRVPLGQAQGEVHRARRLASHLPETQRLYDDGQITARHVAKIVAGTAHLGRDKCGQVEALVLPDAPRLSVHEFARRVRRAVARVHPRDLADRHREAAQQADVDLQTDDDGMAWLTARMPLVDALVVYDAVNAFARQAKAAGDPRPLGVLRAKALREFADRWIAERTAATGAAPVEVHVTATPEMLLGLTDTPGEVPGVGPVAAETIRAMAADAKLRWLTIDGATGRLLDYGRRTYRVPKPLAAHVKATWVTSTGPHSTARADRCDLDHTLSWDSGGRTSVDNLSPLDRGWHLAKTHQRFTAVRQPDGAIRWTTPLGQTYLAEPYDYRLGP